MMGKMWKELAEPFDDYKWKVQTANEYGCMCVAYIDARHVMNRLDDVVGPDSWQVKYEVVSGLLFAMIGIKCGDEWIWKGDTGTESNMEKEKGHVSDAFKRAAVHWGIGRFLYDLTIQKVKSVNVNGKWYPADDNGKRLYGNDQLTEFINSRLSGKKQKQAPATPKPTPPAKPKKDEAFATARKAMFAAMNEAKVSQEALKAFIAMNHGVESTSELTVDDLKKIRRQLKETPNMFVEQKS